MQPDASFGAQFLDEVPFDDELLDEPGPPEADERFKMDPLTARQMCALPDPPTGDQLLGPLVVRRYRTLIAAGTGEGKTTFSLALVKAIVDRGEFLDWDGAGGRALVIDLEQGVRTVKRRLRQAGLDESDDVDYVRRPEGIALDADYQHKLALEELLDANRYDVVLLDPWYKAHRGDSNAEREQVDLMLTLDAWRDHFGFALILPVHTRKKLEPKGRLTIDDIFGSSAISRGAEVVVGLQRLGAGYSRLYHFKDRDGDGLEVGAEPWGLLFDQDTGYRRDPADTSPPRDLLAEIDAWVREHPRSTTNQITNGVGASRGKVQELLKSSDLFTFKAGPNRSRLWVAQDAEYHPGHLFEPESSGGGPAGGPSVGGPPPRPPATQVVPEPDEHELERLAALGAELGL